ncbi:centrosomal protein of 70 kDa-like isoform X1 [Porites lutea]|uniref:centrosomal protein of 70 kDa-like isoform X1 n=2 Tax=Porites lutea TaxID=51062 RepID=UPI003CC6D5B4
MMAKKEDTDMLASDTEESEETPKTAGVIAEWSEVNRKLRHHGFQPVMVLPSSRLQHLPGEAVVLEEFTSKNLRHTLDKLMTDCDRRQSMVQELISSSHRIQRDADEERNRVYRFEMEIRNLQRELEEEKLKTQEMERVRLVELQHHGEEVQELKRSKAELAALHGQLEHKVSQKEAEITRLQREYQELIQEGRKVRSRSKLSKYNSPYRHDTTDQSYESQLSRVQQEVGHLEKKTEMHSKPSSVDSFDDQRSTSQSDSNGDSVCQKGAITQRVGGSAYTPKRSEVELATLEKQLRESKKLIKLLESENTHLKMELESRPNRDQWKNARKYNKKLEKILAENNLSPPRKMKQKEKRAVETEAKPSSKPQRYRTNIEDIDFLPIDVCREYLKEVCGILEINNLQGMEDKVNSLKLPAQSYPAMEKLIRNIMELLSSKDCPSAMLSEDILSQSSHEFHCERAWQNIVPVLRKWLNELTGLKDLEMSIRQLSSHLMPWKQAGVFQGDHKGYSRVHRLKEAVDALCQEKRASPSEIQTDQEPSFDHLKSIVAHFQKLFDVYSIEGIFPRMNEIYMQLGETYNSMNNMRDLLGLEPTCKSSDVVNAVAKLSKAKHLLMVEDLPGIIKRLDQYDEFFPAFQSLVSELKRLLRVQEMDEIITAVTALVKFPPY